jgi:putative FmdB family regulatory protein
MLMPIYEYVCDECQEQFEKIVMNKAQAIACPKCASSRNTIQLSVFSPPAGSPAKSPTSFSGGGGGGCGSGGCGCH